MEVHVIRHTVVAVGKDICYGQSDVPLADSFSQDVSDLTNQLSHDFDAVYCSSLNRCEVLAKALNFNNFSIEKALMEMNFGDWENKKWSDIDQNELNNWMVDFVNVKAPNGENLNELFERVAHFMDKLRQQSFNKVLLITHAGVIRCIWAYLLCIPLKNIFKVPVGHKEIFIFQLAKQPDLDSIKRLR